MVVTWAPGRGVDQWSPRPACVTGGDEGLRPRLQAHPTNAGQAQAALGPPLYLGTPSERGLPSAQASLGVPAFLGFCLAFLRMWTCPRAGEVRGQHTVNQPTLVPRTPSTILVHWMKGKQRGCVVATCGAGAPAPPLPRRHPLRPLGTHFHRGETGVLRGLADLSWTPGPPGVREEWATPGCQHWAHLTPISQPHPAHPTAHLGAHG